MIIYSNCVKSILADLNAQTWVALQGMTVLKDLGSAVIVSFLSKMLNLKSHLAFSVLIMLEEHCSLIVYRYVNFIL